VRSDGPWEGWIEFVAVGSGVALRTDQETAQSNREGVAYWASGPGGEASRGRIRPSTLGRSLPRCLASIPMVLMYPTCDPLAGQLEAL
jgi:hypothetical protein